MLFIEGLKPISDATRSLIARKFKGAEGLSIGMSPALVIGHPTTLVVSLLLIPVTLLLAVVLPGNQFLPLASLAGMFYVFPLVLPFTKGNVVKTFIVGLVVMVIALLFGYSTRIVVLACGPRRICRYRRQCRGHTSGLRGWKP